MKTNWVQYPSLISLKNPIRRALAFIFIGAMCVLTTSVFAGDPEPVSRPVKVTNGHGNLLITVDPLTGNYTFTDSGVASHLGLFTNTGSGC